MTIFSFAQNFEDVMLWRVLGRFTPGRYVDVGAQDPIVDSVSKAFHDAGWQGVHVEPSPFYADALRKAFPDDKVIEAAVAGKAGSISFYEVPGGGLSTARADVAQFHCEHAGLASIERKVVAVTLAKILKDLGSKPIHWLKIDVEGLEREVLESWEDAPQRPWVVVVESTFPTTNQPTHEEWEHLVTAKGYDLVYSDGLNRFYLFQDYPELREHFRYPPNVFDNFELRGTATSWTGALARRHEAELEERSSQIGDLERAVEQVAVERNGLRTALVHEQLQRQLDQIGVAAELQRLRQVERVVGELETAFAERLERTETTSAKLAMTNLDLARSIESSKTELGRLTSQIDAKNGLIAEWQGAYEAQFQLAVNTAYNLTSSEEKLAVAREENSCISRELDSRMKEVAKLSEALDRARREIKDLGENLTRVTADFWVRLLNRLRVVQIGTSTSLPD